MMIMKMYDNCGRKNETKRTELFTVCYLNICNIWNIQNMKLK